MKLRLLGLILLLHTGNVFCFGQKTFFGTRSQALNGVRDLVGAESLIPRQYPKTYIRSEPAQEASETTVSYCVADEVGCDKSYVVLSAAVEYDRSFHPSRISEFLFGCNPCMVFSGSRVPYRGSSDILADYFGLPADFQSTVSFNPIISSAIVDFNAFFGLDDWTPGLYFQLHVPIVHTKWDLNMCEQVQNAGEDFHPAGYMSPVRIERAELADSVSQYFGGNFTFGDMHDPLRYGKICGSRSLTQLAEVHATLGWNYVRQEEWHAGIGLRTAMKAWNGSTAQYLFEPVLGNCGHWELGATLTGHWQFWECNNHQLAFYCDAYITHLFGSNQLRSYDLNSGNGSRYMLLEYFDTPPYDLQNSLEQAPSAQYRSALTPAINLTTLETKIKMNVQADVVFKFAYQYKNWEVDLGYNFFGRSAETCEQREALCGTLALKGDAQVYGFNSDDNPVPVSATQHNATINTGQGVTNFVTGSEFANVNADNPEFAFDTLTFTLSQLNSTDAADLAIPQQQIFSSFDPIFLTDADINVCSGLLPRAISNKVFINAAYIWKDALCIIPYVSAGASGEWAGTNACNNSAFSQWGVWIKGGLTY